MILICYDGSDDAKEAIRQARPLLQGYRTVVLTVWEPFAPLMAANPSDAAVTAPSQVKEIDEANRLIAQQTAEEGARLAQGQGFEAAARIAPRVGSIADVILSEAKRRDVSVIVLGSRGHGGGAPRFLGSISHAVLQRADRAVLVVPSTPTARRPIETMGAHVRA